MPAIELTWEDDLAVLTIDTPSCDVNIFTLDAATEMSCLLPETTRARALLLRSAKPRSFVNGVGLMMASAARGPDDVRRLTKDVRAAFAELRASPIPTIAALRGSTFGCGVELSLHCDYRVAADVFDTEIYMTEIAEYLMVPAFGSTQDLPALVGLEAATELLLWGERWWPREAVRRGLVDATFSHRDFEAGARAFARAAKKPVRVSKRDVDPSFVAATKRRIAALPPLEQPAHAACFQLLLEATERERPDYDAELVACGASLAAAPAKAALSFFFVRQLAEKTALRDHVAKETVDVELHGESLAGLRWSWEAKRLTHARFVEGPGESATRLDLYPRGEAPRSGVEVETSLVAGVSPRSAALIYAPIAGSRFVEIVAREREIAQSTYSFLSLAGYAPVLTREASAPLTHALLTALVEPQVRFLARRGDPADVFATLREIGFSTSIAALVRSASEDAWLSILPHGARDREALQTLMQWEGVPGRAHPQLSAATTLSLLAAAVTARESGQLVHVTAFDLAAHELLGFPLGRGPFCRWATRVEVERSLAFVGDSSPLLGIPAREVAKRHVIEGRPFY